MNKQEILEFIKAQTFVTLASINEGGFPESRMLVNLQNPAIAPHLTEYFAAHDHVLYLMTNTHSEKIAQLSKNPKASLYYADTGDFKGMLPVLLLRNPVDGFVLALVGSLEYLVQLLGWKVVGRN